MNVEVGQIVGPYTILRRVGSGGMAVVYEAEDQQLARKVALKMLHAGLQDDSDLLMRFQREGEVVSQLVHPHIVPVYEFAHHAGQPYMVMLYIPGHTLKWHLRKRVLPLADITRIGSAIAHALTFAHARGVLHRDVKPGNVLIDDDGVPYLTDFGLARVLAQGESSLSAGMIVGTPHYLSPEQASGEYAVGPATDTYSLGVMLYEMVVGQVPFSSETPHAIIYDHIYTEPPYPTDVNAEIPTAVADVLMKALAKDPAERYDTPNAFMDAFRQAVADSNLETLSDDRSEVAARSISMLRKKKPGPSSAAKKEHVVAEFDFGQALNNALSGLDRDLSNIAPSIAGVIDSARTAWREMRGEDDHRPYIPPTEAELDAQIHERVQRRMRARRGWWAHFVVFLVINGIIIGTGSTFSSDMAAAAISAEYAGAEIGTVLYHEGQVALISATRPWGLIVVLFWLGGLLAHRVKVGSYSARVQDKQERRIMERLDAQYGPNWPNTITRGQYRQAEREVSHQLHKVTGFWAHLMNYLTGNLALLFAWGVLLQPILLAVIDLVKAQGDLEAVNALTAFVNASPPPVLIISALWTVGLVIHAVGALLSQSRSLENELAHERQLAESRRTPRKAKRGHPTTDEFADLLADHSPRPVRFDADGELTNSTVDAWNDRGQR